MGKWLYFLLVTTINISRTGSDWLNCAEIPVCHCKWSSGKKTASCVIGNLNQPPSLSSDIQVLDLHGNPLKILRKDAFADIGLVNLQRLNLSLTNLQHLHANTFRELRILVELDLSSNEIQHLSPDTFLGNDRLRLLVLNDNPLSRLEAQQFPPLQHLKRLELARCRLEKIHPWAFINLKSLETILVHQNLLTYLHQDTFDLPVLKTLTLTENPWNCDCRLRLFHKWFQKNNLGSEDITCRRPEHLMKHSWKDLEEKDFICLPEVVSTPNVIRTESGANIMFGCYSRGYPVPKLKWYYQNIEVQNETYRNSEISVYLSNNSFIDEYNDDVLNKTIQWLNVTINNVTSYLSGEWTCKSRSRVGEVKDYMTLLLPKAISATTITAPDYSAVFAVGGSILAMTSAGFIAACFCWKTRRRRVPPSRSFTDQEKKLLDTSLAVSYDRTSGDVGSSYGFEMLDRSLSMDSGDTQRFDPVQITIEPQYPPPPAEFALPAPYGNIFISVKVSRHSDGYPDILYGGATLPRRSKTCFLQSDYDNMGPRVTAAGSSVWSLPDSNNDKALDNTLSDPQKLLLSTFSTEFTAL